MSETSRNKAKEESTFEEKSKDPRVLEEFQRLSHFFEDLAEHERSVILPLIQNAAFMRVTLEDLQEIIADQGAVEAYQNGENQYGMKQSAALQSYNSLIKNYAALEKNLFNLLPPMKRPAVIPKEKTPEEIAEDLRRDEERKAEIDLAIEFQQWQREQENAGKDVNISFQRWKEEVRTR